MELRELAERVLLGTTLEEKLTQPVGGLTDLHPGRAAFQDNCPLPQRPQGLNISPGAGPGCPSLRELDQEPRRGLLLHHLANHELLAAELMALALLKFPDAPSAFRSGLARTLIEEQEHTRLYMERMRACGLEFGEHPVNGSFWSWIADMVTPMDYVARLSLTFEQANLDFSRAYAGRFRSLGDEDTACLFDRIHEDEIRHVRQGLHWFRKWKDPEQSDWEAYRGLLTFPLSPGRAKSEPFDEASRLKAGLDADFITELRVFHQSKGKTPRVHWFNPFAEDHCQGERKVEPTRLEAQLVRDLETIQLFLARRDDVVLLQERPDSQWILQVQSAGWPVPEIQTRQAAASLLAGRPLEGLRPWAWAPDSLRDARDLGLEEAVPAWARVEGVPWLDKRAWFPSDEESSMEGAWLDTWEAVQDWIGRARASGPMRLVAKSRRGAAGRGLLRLWEPQLTAAQEVWMKRELERRGCLRLEPWLERVADFSLHYDLELDGSIRERGTCRNVVDHRGQYQATITGHSLWEDLAPGDRAWLLRSAPGSESPWESIRREVAQTLTRVAPGVGYTGPVGVDGFLYRLSDGSLAARPWVEVNARWSFGRVAIELARKVSHGRRVLLRVGPVGHFPAESWRAAWKLDDRGRLRDGCLPLTPPGMDRRFAAWLAVGSEAMPGSALCPFLPGRNRATSSL